MASLRAVPGRPPRAVCYLRQSTHRDDSVSLELQETACRDYAARMGYEVVAVEADPGISGRTFKRPGVQRVMGMIESGDADVIILWRWSRLSRSRRDWAVAADAVDVAGGRIEAATESVDITTSTGRLARGMLVEIAAFESERIGDVWRETHSRRVRDGKPHSGKPRWGYAYDRETKAFHPDEKTGPTLASLYRRYIAGESFYALVKWLNDEGYRTSSGYGPGGPWSMVTLKRVLDSGFGAGLVNYRGEQYPGVHEPVITEHEWKRYQVERKKRSRGTGTGERSTYLLSGLIYCACGSRMSGGRFGNAKVPKYRCAAASKERRHDGGYVTCEHVEQIVREWVLGLDLDIPEPEASKRDVQALAREVTALDRQLGELTRHLVSGLVPEAAYRSTRDEIESQRERLTDRLREAEVDAARVSGLPGVVRSLREDWDTLPVAQRRAALGSLLSRVVVTAKRPASDVRLVPRWGEQSR